MCGKRLQEKFYVPQKDVTHQTKLLLRLRRSTRLFVQKTNVNTQERVTRQDLKMREATHVAQLVTTKGRDT